MGLQVKNRKNLLAANDGYTINLVDMQKSHTQRLVKGFVCIGLDLPIEPDIEYLVNGTWEESDRGLQLIANKWELVPQNVVTLEVIEGLLVQVIDQNEKKGSSFIETPVFYEAINQELRRNNQSADEKTIDKAFLKLLKEKKLIVDRNKVYRKKTYENECSIARDVMRLSIVKKHLLKKDLVEGEILNETNRTGIVLARGQKNAILRTLENQISILTGGGGTGKTTIVRFITNIYLKHYPDAKIRLLSPTGKASVELNKGLQEHINLGTQERAKTIHGHLGIIPQDMGGYEIIKDITIDEDFLIVDEFSMVDLALAKELFRSIQNGTKVLILGDIDQLESVALGSVLKDLINSHAIPCSHLDRVYRQGKDSLIKNNSFLIKRGNDELEYGDDFQYIHSESFEQSAHLILEHYFALLETEAIEDVMILSPYRKKTDSGVNALNQAIQKRINPPAPDKEQMVVEGKTYREGDRIVFTVNNDRTMNGEVGTIQSIKEGQVNIRIDKKAKDITFDEDDPRLKIDLAYAMTVHKSQGSEYKHCIFTLNKDHYNVTRNLLYTAITRAKEKLIFIGEQEAIKKAVANVSSNAESPLQKRMIDYKKSLKGGKEK